MKLKQATFIQTHSEEIMKGYLDVLENDHQIVIRQNITEATANVLQVTSAMDDPIGGPKVLVHMGRPSVSPKAF